MNQFGQEVEFQFNTKKLPASYAHVIEHLLCRILVNQLKGIRVKGNTTEHNLRVSWVGDRKYTALELLSILLENLDQRVLEQEKKVIGIELSWLSKVFESPHPETLRYETIPLLIECLYPVRESAIDIVLDDVMWTSLTETYNKSAKRVSRFQQEKQRRYPASTVYEPPDSLIFCRPLVSASTLSHPLLRAIHHWYWVVNALSQYASTLTQSLRKSSLAFYSYGFGVFPYCGTWYLYLTALQQGSLDVFLDHFFSEFDKVVNSKIECIKLLNHVNKDIVVELYSFSQEPNKLARMMMNSSLDFSDFTELSSIEISSSSHDQALFSSELLGEVLTGLHSEVESALEEIVYV